MNAEKVRQAQEKILEAIELLKEVADATNDRYAEEYIIAPLEIVASDNHSWVSRDKNLDDWIREMEERYHENAG